LVRELLRGKYLDKKENMLFIVNQGTGKTHLVCGLAFSACAQGRSVRFYTALDLGTQLGECREGKKLQRLHKHQRLHLLVIDELGYVVFSKTGAELLFEVISWAYMHHNLMLTKNLAFEEWTEIFGFELLTGTQTGSLTGATSWR
jgi:DNA replication protein DnaC